MDRNVHTHTAEVRLNNGFAIKVDVGTGKVYVTKGLQTKTFLLDTVLLQAANGNAQLAAQRKAKLVRDLSAPIGNTRLLRLDPQTASAYARVTSNTLVPPNSTYPDSYAHPDIIDPLDPTNPSIGGGSDPWFQCDFAYMCDFKHQFGGNTGLGSGNFGFWFYDNPLSGAPGSQPNDPDDYSYWNRWRKDHCDQASDEWGQADLAAAAFGYLLLDPVPGWAGAAISGLGAIYTGIQATGDQRICDSSYPGKGKW